ncbi:hypothetical protein [Streptomyces caatingaensis]|uniref:hypothetical protein n=1 Tax=Streptomyces caatingaensis TaxID=1678637 RepID=UPI00069E2E07
MLAQTGTWQEWTARTQVLGVAAARCNVVELWLREEPQSVAARVMYARVTTERALDAHRSRASAEDPRRMRQLDELADRARQACRVAGELNPGDPVAPICLLALAETDTAGRFPEHRVAPPPPDFLLPHGPWGLLEAAHRRDAYSREAWQRMLRVLQVGPGSEYLSRRAVAMDFARWSASKAPIGSPLLLLPLYAHVEEYRARRSRGDSMLSLWWVNESITPAISKAFEDWFGRCDPAAASPTDLGRWSRPIGWVAVLWAAGASVLFLLPQSSPVTAESFNYAPVALLVALAMAALWWRTGRRSYRVPRSGTANAHARTERLIRRPGSGRTRPATHESRDRPRSETTRTDTVRARHGKEPKLVMPGSGGELDPEGSPSTRRWCSRGILAPPAELLARWVMRNRRQVSVPGAGST